MAGTPIEAARRSRRTAPETRGSPSSATRSCGSPGARSPTIAGRSPEPFERFSGPGRRNSGPWRHGSAARATGATGPRLLARRHRCTCRAARRSVALGRGLARLTLCSRARGALPVGTRAPRLAGRPFLADLGLAVGADPPARIERLVALAARVPQPPLAVRAAQVALVDRVLAVRARVLDPLAQFELRR